jgi:hypothetical protein
MRTAHHARRSIPPRSAFAGFPSDVIVLGASEARARGAFFPLRAAAAFALVSADLEAGLESLWPSWNATSLGGSTTMSPCCSSNAAANPPRVAASRQCRRTAPERVASRRSRR